MQSVQVLALKRFWLSPDYVEPYSAENAREQRLQLLFRRATVVPVGNNLFIQPEWPRWSTKSVISAPHHRQKFTLDSPHCSNFNPLI
jgi:hypothetical protein